MEEKKKLTTEELLEEVQDLKEQAIESLISGDDLSAQNNPVICRIDAFMQERRMQILDILDDALYAECRKE